MIWQNTVYNIEKLIVTPEMCKSSLAKLTKILMKKITNLPFATPEIKNWEKNKKNLQIFLSRYLGG